MKRIAFICALLACSAVSVFAQSGNVPITITEVDGSPRLTNPSKIVVSNGTLTISGRTATISTGGGGGGGCTPPGTAKGVYRSNSFQMFAGVLWMHNPVASSLPVTSGVDTIRAMPSGMTQGYLSDYGEYRINFPMGVL